MADQTGEDAEVSLTGPAAEWVRGKADELGMGEADLLKRLVAVFRTIDEDRSLPSFATEGDVAELQERVDDLSAELDEKVSDVRERVVQVKREANEKAPADHDHADIERNVETALETARSAQSATDTVADRVDDLEQQVEGGFRNYESVLEYLTDETEELNGKISTLAHVATDLRDGVEHLAAREERRSAADRLADQANRHGIREAECEECQRSVDIALLSGPTCPFCDSTFVDVEPKAGFLGSSTLVVGDRPALEAPAAEDTTDVLADLVESAEPTEPPAPNPEGDE